MDLMDQIAAMDRSSLVNLLDQAEECLLAIQQILDQKNSLEHQKTNLQAKSDGIQKKLKSFPFIPGIIVAAIMTLFNMTFIILLIAVIAAAVLYRNKQFPVMESQMQEIQTQEIPSVEQQIVQCNDCLKQMEQPAQVVKSLLGLLPDNHRDLETIRGVKNELKRGARDWYSALSGYEGVLARQEQQRQMQEMQESVHQVAVSSERTARSVEEVRKHTENIAKNTEDIARNTERTATAAETSARNSARTRAAAEKSAEYNARAAEAAERQASAAESAAYWIYYS